MRNVLITGGSSGIGYGLVKKFLDSNYQVFAVSRNIESLKLLNSDKLTIISADITNHHDRDNISKLVQGLELDFINNAGGGAPELFKNLTIDSLKEQFEVNFFAPVELIQNIVKQCKIGRVLNMTSGAAQNPVLNLFSYCTSKAAFHHAISCLKLEHKETYFTNLRPGFVDTPLINRWSNISGEIYPDKNPYFEAKQNNKLISVEVVADFVFWVMNLPKDEFAKQDWNIYEEEHHKNWLKTSSLFNV